jgi:hypothetical protein
MINLIPAEAKKHLLKEYWIRSVTVWFFLWTFALLLGATLLAPSYVLLSLQINAYGDSAQKADEKNANFEAVAKDLKRASEIAAFVSERFERPSMTEYLTLLKNLESADVSVARMSLNRNGDSVEEISVSGVADSRQALADFRNRMLASEQIESVDLPISNLAKDKEIPFELTITLAKQKTP